MADADMARPSAESIGWAELLAARLCHDLSGLAGTVAGMLELAEDPEQTADALPVAREAAAGLLARVRVLRAAWGRPEPFTLGPLCASLAGPRLRVEVDAAALAAGETPEAGRLLLNVVLLGCEVLQGRGTVALAGTGQEVVATLTGRAGTTAWPELPGAAPSDARGFQAAWTRQAAAACGAELLPDGPALRVRLRT